MPAGAGQGIVVGYGDECGHVWAAFDQTARHVEPRPGPTRFAARLAPFRSRDAAIAAIAEMGAVTAVEEVRR